MAKSLSIAERVIIHTLLDARGPVPIATLAELTGVVPHSVRSAISAVRPALAEVGVRVTCNGTLAGARYCLHAPDRAAVRALIGPKVERPCFMGFLDRYGAILKFIVEAAGRPVSANEIAGAVYARDHGETRRRVSSMIREIRATLAKQGAAETIHQTGPAAAPLYAWGSSAEAPEAVVVPSEGVTLPSVAGVYRYAAGRLTLDGRPAGRMA